MRRSAPVARISASACGRMRFSASGAGGGAISAGRSSALVGVEDGEALEERDRCGLVAGFEPWLRGPALGRRSAFDDDPGRRAGDHPCLHCYGRRPRPLRHLESARRTSRPDTARVSVGGDRQIRQISKCGDRMLRHLLYEAASALMTRTRKWSRLRAWGVARRQCAGA